MTINPDPFFFYLETSRTIRKNWSNNYANEGPKTVNHPLWTRKPVLNSTQCRRVSVDYFLKNF